MSSLAGEAGEGGDEATAHLSLPGYEVTELALGLKATTHLTRQPFPRLQEEFRWPNT